MADKIRREDTVANSADPVLISDKISQVCWCCSIPLMPVSCYCLHPWLLSEGNIFYSWFFWLSFVLLSYADNIVWMICIVWFSFAYYCGLIIPTCTLLVSRYNFTSFPLSIKLGDCLNIVVTFVEGRGWHFIQIIKLATIV